MGDKLNETFQLFFGNIVLIGAVVLTILLPLELIGELATTEPQFDTGAIQRMGQTGDFDPDMIISMVNSVAAQSSTGGVFALLALLLSPIYYGAVIHIVAQKRQGLEISYSDAMQVGLQNWWRMIWANILALIIVIAGLFFCIVPGVLFAVWFAFIPAMVILEGANNPVDAISRSSELTKGRRWEIFGVWLILFLIGMFFNFILSGIGLVFPFNTDVPQAILSSLMTLVSILPVIAFVLFYMDARYKEAGMTTEGRPVTGV